MKLWITDPSIKDVSNAGVDTHPKTVVARPQRIGQQRKFLQKSRNRGGRIRIKFLRRYIPGRPLYKVFRKCNSRFLRAGLIEQCGLDRETRIRESDLEMREYIASRALV